MYGREKNHNPFLLEHQIRKSYKKCSMKTGFSVRLSPDWVFDLYRIQCSRLSGIYNTGKTAEAVFVYKSKYK